LSARERLVAAMSGFVRFHSVIPGFFRHSGLDPESKFIGTRRRKNFRKGRNVSGDLQPFNMDPGSSPGVTGC
jgi:hypothetical protein